MAKKLIAAACAVAVMLIASAQLAKAQARCAPQPIALNNLFMRYGETVVEGITHDEILFQLFANQESGTWTVTGMKSGVMCMVASGKNYSNETLNMFRAKVSGQAT